jgi:predicted AlkP superfamily pyrophosphatase or phosphodiesterase
MAKFVTINDTALSEIQMSDYADFFTQHIFFKFMDHGRTGMQQGVQDLIDTSLARVIESITINTNKTPDLVTADLKARRKRAEKLVSDEMFKKLYDWNMPRIMSAFINGGTKEMRSAIFSCATDPLMFE